MKTLEAEFEKKGWKFKLVERVGAVAIYERSKANVTAPHWELVMIREMKGGEAFGVKFDDYEKYPADEEWGVYGWTCMDLADADRRAAVLIGAKSFLPPTRK